MAYLAFCSLPAVEARSVLSRGTPITEEEEETLIKCDQISSLTNVKAKFNKWCYQLAVKETGAKGCAGFYTQNVKNGNTIICQDDKNGNGKCDAGPKFQCPVREPEETAEEEPEDEGHDHDGNGEEELVRLG